MTFGILSGFMFATSLDTAGAKVKWTAFKTTDKVAVSGTFDDIQYKFGKGHASIKEILEGATAILTPSKVNLNDALKNKNVREYFFAKFKTRDDIKVTFKKVIEGKDKGTIFATIKMNGKIVKVPMQYEIKDNFLEAKGVIDLAEFYVTDALNSLTQAVKNLHGGLTWTQVEIQFSAPVKN